MRKLSVSLFVLFVLCASIPAAACNQRCNYATGDCETVGWTTYMACETWGGFCTDVPVSGCRGLDIAEVVADQCSAPPAVLDLAEVDSRPAAGAQ